MPEMHDYTRVMDGPFKPLYPYYADLIVRRTGITKGSLLDIGSNRGDLGFAVLERGDFSYAGFLDIKAEPLEKARNKAEEHGYGGICDCINCSVEDIDIADESIDLAVSRGSMPFWEDQRQAIREIYRVLKPEGVAYIGVGRGTRAMQEASQDSMRKVRGDAPRQESRHLGRRGSNMLSDSQNIELFRELGCSYAIISKSDEGHWLVFAKKPQ